MEDVAVEEEDVAESLVLVGCEVGEEGGDFFGTHVFGVAFVMEEDVAFDPIFVVLFGAVGVVFEANGIETWSRSLRGGFCSIWDRLFWKGVYNFLIIF